jgi:hypothetical protein
MDVWEQMIVARRSDSPEDRARVFGKLLPHIMEFHDAHRGQEFHADDLYQFVIDREPWCAPESPGRCLRLARQRGFLNYIVIDRNNSLFQFLEQDDD